MRTIKAIGKTIGNSMVDEANARLIAAAPELVQKAQALLNKIDHITTDEFSVGEEREEREALRAAIAKATQTVE